MALGLLVLAAVFAYVRLSSRGGPWMIVYDRGRADAPDKPAEIRYRGKQLAAARVRCLTTRTVGGSHAVQRSLVVAELHDGTIEVLGPSGVSTWPAFFAQHAASWMGLPFRR